jgi:hypothetical protein
MQRHVQTRKVGMALQLEGRTVYHCGVMATKNPRLRKEILERRANLLTCPDGFEIRIPTSEGSI